MVRATRCQGSVRRQAVPGRVPSRPTASPAVSVHIFTNHPRRPGDANGDSAAKRLRRPQGTETRCDVRAEPAGSRSREWQKSTGQAHGQVTRRLKERATSHLLMGREDQQVPSAAALVESFLVSCFSPPVWCGPPPPARSTARASVVAEGCCRDFGGPLLARAQRVGTSDSSASLSEIGIRLDLLAPVSNRIGCPRWGQRHTENQQVLCWHCRGRHWRIRRSTRLPTSP